ncbi:MAG: nonstructural protein [Microvirus sp.]|nr:MAG: nonstructural protein [Microvirus sp.]
MILHICAVLDHATQMYGRPIFVVAKGQAIRSFQDEVLGKDNEFAKHPTDYVLFYMGTFDDNTGMFAPIMPEMLIRGSDVTGAQ